MARRMSLTILLKKGVKKNGISKNITSSSRREKC